jgi:hypothetical protein
MSRLLHAAARGARIQGRYVDDTPQWHTVRKVYLVEDLPYQRIHPDDEHLQYGPISTALRDCDGEFQLMYIDSEQMHDFAIRSAIVANYANNMMHEWQQNKDRLTRSLFLLILAEALADSGL